ncbi:MAG: response regulator [Chloroflexi bacterium]|nr:response regulator [Chloroflexota bacterium]
MCTPLHVLIVEDSEEDARLLLRELGRGGYDPKFERVETPSGMSNVLMKQAWEVVIADYVLPQFSGLAALQLLQEKGLDLPFIVVSGKIGEETAVEAMRAGAHDYIVKGNLTRLVPAIQRELREVANRRERRKTEVALRESEARFLRMAENAHDIIYRYELQPRKTLSYLSPAITRVIGFAPEEYLADPGLVRRIIHPDDRHLLDAMLGSEPPLAVTVRWRHKEGHTVWTELRNVPIQDEAGNLVAVEGIARDISERKKLEEQLLRAQRLEMAGTVVAQVAHDFNNLLSPLAAYPQLIKKHLSADHPAIRYCDTMLKAAQQMSAITDDLMALGRRGHFNQEITVLNPIVEQSIAQMPAQPTTLTVETDLAPDLLPVGGCDAQLLRVVSNLIGNARDAMNDNGILSVSTRNVYVDKPFGHFTRVEVGEYVALQVKDSGRGIAPEIIDRIFDPFFTTKQFSKRRGTGLGLSIVQGIVSDHRGYLDVETEPGKGAMFTVYLPVYRGKMEEQPSQEVVGGNEAILVVDDDEVQREVEREMLGTLGYRVDSVCSGEQAVSYLKERHVDLVVLDMVMPSGIDGAETYRRILAVRPGQQAIIVSGFAERERVREAQMLGAGPYLRKPVTLEKLARAVRDVLDRKAHAKELQTPLIAEPRAEAEAAVQSP